MSRVEEARGEPLPNRAALWRLTDPRAGLSLPCGVHASAGNRCQVRFAGCYRSDYSGCIPHPDISLTLPVTAPARAEPSSRYFAE